LYQNIFKKEKLLPVFPKGNGLFLYKPLPRFTFHGYSSRSRFSFPVADIFTLMFKGKAMPATIILVTVIAMKREIYPLSAKGTVFIYRVFFSFPKKFRKE
jgi:hypothetical protein